jgi:hypothetical protein
MRADLVRAAGQRTRFEQSLGMSPFKDCEVRFRGFAPFMVHGRAVLVTYVGPQQHLADFLLPNRIPLHDGVIDLLHFMPLELAVEFAVRLGCAREDNGAAGDFVQPVDNPDFSVLFLPISSPNKVHPVPSLHGEQKARQVC